MQNFRAKAKKRWRTTFERESW